MRKGLPPDSIENLGLSRWACRVLLRAGVRQIAELVKMTDSDLLSIYELDPKILAEVRSKVRAFLAERANNLSPSTHSNAIVPQPATTTAPSSDQYLYDISVDVLSLSIRVRNALTRHFFPRVTTLGHVALVLREFHESGLNFVRNLGTRGVTELEREFNAYLASHKTGSSAIISPSSSIEPDTTSGNYLLGWWQNLQSALAQEINQERLHGKTRFGGRSLKYWLDHEAGLEDETYLRHICQSLERALACKTICDELIGLVAGVEADRIELFVSRFGLKKHTFEELGQKRKVTRERIRQIVNRTARQVNQKIAASPCLRIQSALAIAEEMGPSLTYSEWVRSIGKSGLLGEWNPEMKARVPPHVPPINLMIAICLLEEPETQFCQYPLPENLSLVLSHKSLPANVIQAIRQLPKQTTRTIRKQAKNGGAVPVSLAAKEFALTVEEARSVLPGLGYQRISDDWYMLRARKSRQGMDRLWAVFHTVLKMLRFCGPLELKDICGGLRHHMSRGGYVIPPPPILAHVLVAHRFDVKEGHVSWHGENASAVSASEKIILQELERLGPVVGHFELAQAFAQAGLSLPTLSATLKHSPLFAKVGMGLYKLRGKVVTRGDVEDAQKRQPITAADPEIVFDPTGTIHFRLNLGSIAITSGVIITTHIPNLTGKWASHASGLACGTVNIRDNQIWGLTKSLRIINAHVGDRVELKFDTWERTVNVTKVEYEAQ